MQDLRNSSKNTHRKISLKKVLQRCLGMKSRYLGPILRTGHSLYVHLNYIFIPPTAVVSSSDVQYRLNF